MRFRLQMRMFTSLFNISQSKITLISQLLQLNTYKKIVKRIYLKNTLTLSIPQRNEIKSYGYVQLYCYLYSLFLQLYDYSDIKINNSYSLQQIQKTSNLDANLISRQYKLNIQANFMRLKYENPKMKQSETANQLSLSSSTIQRYRNDINMLSPYRINPNNNHKRTKMGKITDFDNDSHHEVDVKRPQMTSKDLN